MQRLKCNLQHILSDSKLHLFQRTKATKFDSELTLHFAQSQEVWKNISSRDSGFTPADNLASNLNVDFPDMPESWPV